MVEHTIRGNMFKITEVNKNLYGELLDSNNNIMWRYYPKNYKEKKYQLPNNENYTIREDGIPGDIFSVDTLLNAAGFNLDGIITIITKIKIYILIVNIYINIIIKLQ